MKKSMTITYEVGNNLYVNLTNKCPCACTFCIRNSSDGAYGSDPLWLDHDPSTDEIKADFNKRDIPSYDEIVFCGFGEPTCRLDTLLESAKYLKSLENCPPLRLNTNGLAEAINGTSGSAAKSICEFFDTVSISLNAGTEEEYLRVTRPKYKDAFEIMQNFTYNCVQTGKCKVIMSVVDVIPESEINAARQLCEKLGAALRIRKYDN